MKAVIDEGVPRRVAEFLSRDQFTVSRFSPAWKGMQNGTLLAAVKQAGFDCLITCDKNMPHQQSVAFAGLALIVLPAQRFEDLVPYEAAILSALDNAVKGVVSIVPE